MNKFLLSIGLVTLLAGCDRAPENTTPAQQAAANQMNPLTPTTNTMATNTPATPATTPGIGTPSATPGVTTPAVNPNVVNPGTPVPTTPGTTSTQTMPGAVTTPDAAPANRSAVVTPATPVTPTQPATPNRAANANNALVIDASSEEAMTASLDRMIANLSESEKEAFAEAFLVYAMSRVDMSVDEATNQRNMLAALDGKSVSDIMTEANRIKANAAQSTQPAQSQQQPVRR